MLVWRLVMMALVLMVEVIGDASVGDGGTVGGTVTRQWWHVMVLVLMAVNGTGVGDNGRGMRVGHK